jgi:hypothetical protein
MYFLLLDIHKERASYAETESGKKKVIPSSVNNVRKSAMKLVLFINVNMIVVIIMNDDGH